MAAQRSTVGAAAARGSGDDGASIAVIIAAGAMVLALSFGVRSVFGGVLEPLSADLEWPRETFSMSLAIQNLVWGLAQPLFGVVADKYGDRRALWIGFVLYLAGMALSAVGVTVGAQHIGAGVLVGAGISGTAFGLVLAVVSRASTDANRSQNLGLVAALGSLGQVVMPLFAAYLIDVSGGDWRMVLWVMTAMLLPMAFCIPFLKARAPVAPAGASSAETDETILEILKRAFGYNSYNLLVLGFFVCGFHIAFITVHFPAFVAEVCGDPALGLQAIGIVGFMNVIGTMAFGQLGARYPKPYLLSAIYAMRSLAIFLFISFPITPTTVIMFAVAIGPLWLSTVPLTSGLVAAMFGPKYMATLYGFVFLSHQLGSFLGVWLGGRLYDVYGSYDIVWWTAIGLGIVSALLHLPVSEERQRRSAPA